MTAIIGSFAVLVAFISSAVLAVRGFMGMRNSSVDVGKSLKWPVFGLVAGAVAAMSLLEIGILLDDFSIEYIANNSASTTPTLFKVAAGWAALEGSIVLWGLVLAIFVYTVYRQASRSEEADQLGAGALAVLGVIAFFFFGLMLPGRTEWLADHLWRFPDIFGVSNPFRVCIEAGSVGCFEGSNIPWTESIAALEGRGPNALLQNHFLMAVHPPMLYFGYVGMAVPYAFAMSALMLGSSGSLWLQRTRAWTLITWGFLTTGIVLGGWWSYEVLGWGGYWAWDPVENASFIPWLIATVFLHSAIVQQRRGMLQAWNFMLIISTFAATILGTFLTRSGVIVSVHSFTQSPIGPALLWFLTLVLVASFALFATRIDLVASSPRLDSLVSREGVFLLNNLLLTVFAIVVLVGTLYPMFLERFSDTQVSVGRPFFDRLAIPISLALLAATAIGPITPYRSAKGSVVWQRIRVPLRLALGAAALAVVLGHRRPVLLVGILAAAFLMFVILRNLYDTAKKVSVKREIALPAAILHVARSDRGYWGGQLSHFGVALLALGIVLSSNLSTEAEITLVPGQTATVAGYDITFLNQFSRVETHRSVTGAAIEVSRGGDVISYQEPRLNTYNNSAQAVATPAVYESVKGDLYLALRSINPQTVVLGVWWFPFIWLVWAGGMLMGLAVLWSRLVRKPARESTHVSQTAGDGR